LLKTGELIGVSIAGRGGATEIVTKLQGTDNEAALDRTLAFLLAGRAAEIVTFGDATMGSGGSMQNNDLARATELATLAETSYGFGKSVGLVHLGTDTTDAIRTRPEILEAVRDRLDRALAVATRLLNEHLKEVAAIAAALADRDYLSAAEVDEVINKATRRRSPTRGPNRPPKRVPAKQPAGRSRASS
jgi:ATP-dependent Zn protease